jgi:hypothetical protein
LARGWLRQVDTDLNARTLYDHAPTTDGYRSFLDQSAVDYVAVPDARLSAFGRREAKVIPTLPYLHEVWRNDHWTLYSVDQPTPIVGEPGQLLSYGAAALTIETTAGRLTINVRWSDWLSVSGPSGCIASDGDRVVLEAKAAGRYTISSTLGGHRRHC